MFPMGRHLEEISPLSAEQQQVQREHTISQFLFFLVSVDKERLHAVDGLAKPAE